MELLRYLTREEQVAGLLISDDFVRLACIAPAARKGGKPRLAPLAEHAVPDGAIVDGRVADATALTNALKELSRKAGNRPRFVVASIPPHTAYLRHFSFPKSVDDRKLDEAMKLAVDFEFPVPADNVFLDWEKRLGPDTSDATIASIPRKVAEEYVSCVTQAGLHVIALELVPHSIVRAAAIQASLDAPSKDAWIMTDTDSSGTSFAIVRNREILFLRTVPAQFVGKAAMENEEKRIARFCTSRYGAPTATLPTNRILLDLAGYDTPPISEKDAQWLAALGAAMRAAMPRYEDTLLSLMSIGTERAYEYQRAAVFSTFVAHLTIGLALFFIIGWLASFSLLVAVQQNFSVRINSLSGIPRAEGAFALEQRAADLNTLLAKAGPLVKRMPRWSELVADVYAALPSSVTVTSLSIPSPDGTISLAGIAADRATLNNLKKTLQSWSAIRNLNFPVQNITQRDAIPFSASFTLLDPASYYPR